MSVYGRYRRRVPEVALLLAALSLLAAAVLGYAVHHQETSANGKIVDSGRVAIQSGCRFDNQRAHAIRRILRRGKAATRGYYLQGLLNRQQYLASLRESDRAIREIVVRDCRRAALVLHR